MNRYLDRGKDEGSFGVFESKKRPLNHVDEAKGQKTKHEGRNHITQRRCGGILPHEDPGNWIAQHYQRCGREDAHQGNYSEAGR